MASKRRLSSEKCAISRDAQETAGAKLQDLRTRIQEREKAHLIRVAEHLNTTKSYPERPREQASKNRGGGPTNIWGYETPEPEQRPSEPESDVPKKASPECPSIAIQEAPVAVPSTPIQANLGDATRKPSRTILDYFRPVSLRNPKKSIRYFFAPFSAVHKENSSRAAEDVDQSDDDSMDFQPFTAPDLPEDESEDFREAEGADLVHNGSADFSEAAKGADLVRNESADFLVRNESADFLEVKGADLVQNGSADFPEAGSADFQDFSRTGSADFQSIVQGSDQEDDMLFELPEFQELANIEGFPMKNADEVEGSQAGGAEEDEDDSENGDAASVIQGFQAPLRNVGPPTNRGKKDRRAFELPIRVWIPSNASQGAWNPIDTLSNAIQAKLRKKLNEVLRTKKSKPLWARWTDPINAPSHYNQCIANGLILRKGRKYAENHEACAWCVKKHLLCALLHEAPMGQSIFVGILPLERGLRVGQEPRQISYWIERDATYDDSEG
ncbi:uncharacterized protein J4E92_010526 [Alternaria infectoria]|uniref:uncharacterized protein n=1 Tax=Alternaria infectoria TaxID=45303 RepID=UPI00221F3E64|nr:uncharacterized protein J4E92_010526 [Alternaria infectoria]KAI4909910.1 hypothetical protein J4E92_010526 [Alternaria infectoria]